ncbi:hypothetical protein GCM10027440_40310 [Nocardiopsis coralliicola]
MTLATGKGVDTPVRTGGRGAHPRSDCARPKRETSYRCGLFAFSPGTLTAVAARNERPLTYTRFGH